MARPGVAADLDSAEWRHADMPFNGDVTGGWLRPVRSPEDNSSAPASTTAGPRRSLVDRLGVNRLGVRLVAGVLLVTLPIVTAMAVLLTSRSSDALTAASYEKSASLARAVALRMADWLRERDQNILAIVNSASALTETDAGGDALQGLETALDDFRLIAVVDAAGQVIVATGDAPFDARAEPWWPDVVAGERVVTTPTEDAGTIEWMIAEPITDAEGRVAGAVIGALDIASLSTLLDTGLDDDTEVGVVDGEGRLVFDTEMGRPADDAGFINAGALRWTITNEAIDQARAEGVGTARFVDRDGHDVIAGAAVVQGTDWVIVAQEHTSDSLAPVRRQRTLATQLGVAAAILAVVFALLFARSTTKPLRALTRVARRAQRGDLDARVPPAGPVEMRDLARSMNDSMDSIQGLMRQMIAAGLQVNAAAAELSAASDELAATTTEQSAAVTQASATTEELARASSVIADTVDEVAGQTADTRTNLEHAERDIQESSTRTVALAGRINEIGALLTLINEIANQTGLLALNAAIEAARAGEEGRGFAVVAEEVRRLADSSKASAADIERIVEGIHSETSATVMAMEKGAKQMQHGLGLLDHVTDAADHVRLTTQQQRSATAQVVETMDQLTDASRQVAITAQQIAGSASNLASLARKLDESTELVSGRKRA